MLCCRDVEEHAAHKVANEYTMDSLIIHVLLLYLENTTVFTVVISCSFVVFIRHTSKAAPWKCGLTFNRSVAQKTFGKRCTNPNPVLL